MSSIEIKKVESRYDLKKFIEFHYDLYEGNPYDVPNLYSDDVNTLRKDKNAAFDKQYLSGRYGADPYLTHIEEWD